MNNYLMPLLIVAVSVGACYYVFLWGHDEGYAEGYEYGRTKGRLEGANAVRIL